MSARERVVQARGLGLAVERALAFLLGFVGLYPRDDDAETIVWGELHMMGNKSFLGRVVGDVRGATILFFELLGDGSTRRHVFGRAGLWGFDEMPESEVRANVVRRSATSYVDCLALAPSPVLPSLCALCGLDAAAHERALAEKKRRDDLDNLKAGAETLLAHVLGVRLEKFGGTVRFDLRWSGEQIFTAEILDVVGQGSWRFLTSEEIAKGRAAGVPFAAQLGVDSDSDAPDSEEP